MISFLQMSLCAAVLTAIICFVRAALGKRLPKRTFRVLWSVVILRMLVPLSLPIMKINAGTAVSAVSDVSVYTYAESEFTQINVTDGVMPATVNIAAETADRSLSVEKIWLLTAAAVFAVFVSAHVKFRLKVRDALPAEINFEAGLKRQVRIKVSDRIDSPLTYGIFRPVILLPKNIYMCGEKNAEYILSHELTHIKRFDVLYKLLMALAVSLHWFNPLAWVMLVLASRDIELSCDEEVVLRKNGSGREREEYALTLIEMEEKRSLGVLHSGFGGSSVKERIKSVMGLKKATPFGKAAAVLLVAAAFTVFTVYDIESEASYSVAVTSSESHYDDNETIGYAYYYDHNVNEGFAMPFTMEEIDRAANSSEVLVEDALTAVLSVVEATADEGTYETADTAVTKTYSITTANGTETREYPEYYSLYYYGYEDAATGVHTTILIDLNEYAPFDYKKYGLTVSPDKGYYIYNGIPVAGFQCQENTLVDGIAMGDGGGFFIYKDDSIDGFDESAENGIVQVNTAQFFNITGMH
ncbi:MAG: M56 family metallopeptidase, partial [Oscillospiraceae bacterium]|nr:M56 family metallopeptidase [Oscillospiraceae bacterium]